MVHQDRIELNTSVHGAMYDITGHVTTIIARSGVKAGIAHIFNVGSTASIGAIEFEPGLAEDLPRELDRLLPPGLHYGHEQAWHDGNGHSHLQATLMGPDLTIPIGDGAPLLGVWQQIFLLECDVKPRQRTLIVTVMGE